MLLIRLSSRIQGHASTYIQSSVFYGWISVCFTEASFSFALIFSGLKTAAVVGSVAAIFLALVLISLFFLIR